MTKSPLPEAHPNGLAVAGLRRSFYGAAVLQGVDFAVAAGSITGLIGPNGAGKSTVFNVISGLVRPNGGTVWFAGRDVTALAPERLVAQGMVRTFQLARGFPKLSVFQHLMLYAPDQPGEHMAAALFGRCAARQREAAIAERAWGVARRLKLDHVADNPVGALSGGQKKLLEIGRALMTQPRLILLDEPIAGVNPTLAEAIADILRGLRDEGVTFLVIEHHMDLIARLCDPVIVMAEGRRLTEGSFAAVQDDPTVQDAYMGSRRWH
jgi:ABC-type branched-subunit amino acid transport system ATPase component